MRKKEKSKLFDVETVLMGRKKATQRERIRNRHSFAFWQEENLKLNPVLSPLSGQVEKNARAYLLCLIFTILDKKKGWNTQTKACWAEESLDLFLEDEGLSKVRV